MDAEFKIVEDTISTYLSIVESEWESQEPKLIERLGEISASNIKPAVWTSSLWESGLEIGNWEIVSSLELMELYIEYTGRYNPLRWGEFGGFESHSEWRDYAYFQETTIDSTAEPDKARKPWFVRKGMYKSKDKILSETAETYFNILKQR